MPFGQIVIGPPGSGKSTYCSGAHQFLNAVGRKTIIVNLDPANEQIPYDCAINIQDLISLDNVMNKMGLGPNGAMIYCMEYLAQQNVTEWLKMQLQKYIVEDSYYVLFDCPGQIELYTHYDSVKKLCDVMTKDWDFRLAAVNLVDAHYCSNPSNFISVLLVSLSTMINLELPHVNVLSKVDMIEHYGKLAFDIDYYTDVQDLGYLVDYLTKLQKRQRRVNYNFYKGVTDEVEEEELENAGHKRKKQKQERFDSDNEESSDEEDEDEEDTTQTSIMDTRFARLNEALVSIIQDFSLVSFITLHIEDKHSVHKVLQWVDKANGYVFGACEKDNSSIMEVAMSQLEWSSERNDYVRSQFISSSNEEAEEEDDDDEYYDEQ